MGLLSNVNSSYYKGKTAEQTQILKKYFLASGCLGTLLGMKDEAYEALVNAKVAALNLKERALGKIGLDEAQISEIKPVHLESYTDNLEYLAKVGKDNKLRTSAFETTWIFFGE